MTHVTLISVTHSVQQCFSYAVLTTSGSYYQSPYHADTILLTYSLCCTFHLWLIHSITGRLHLPLPGTHFAQAPTPSPLATISLFSVFMGLFLLLLAYCFIFFRFHIWVDTSFANIFSQLVGCHFVLLMVSFAVQKHFILV